MTPVSAVPASHCEGGSAATTVAETPRTAGVIGSRANT
jgi:hypothetical protein